MRLPFLLFACLIGLAACQRDERKPLDPAPPRVDVAPAPVLADRGPQPAPVVREWPTGMAPDDAWLANGHRVYRRACSVCHDSGATGAPRITDVAAWSPRLAKGQSRLYRNAIEGYRGEAGFMPPKGGSPASWSDEEVQAAVDYIAHTLARQGADLSAYAPQQSPSAAPG